VDTSAGNYIILAHHDSRGNRIALTGYGHLEEVWVSVGQTVRARQQIAVKGETGFSAGKHLHFDLVLTPFDVDDAPYYGRVNPNPYFVSGTTYNLNSSQLGTTTTSPTEDEMSAAGEARILQILEAQEADGLRARVIGIDNRTALLLNDISYVKSEQDGTLYEVNADKSLRPITLVEWQATNKPYVTYTQEQFDILYPKRG
jgi:murein DD-endopeptidase MepM/ murein hydrolase activator NlpD